MEIIRQESISGDEDDEPFFICDISDIIRKHQIWKHRMPRVLPFYAVKCNPDPAVIQTLARLGARFDCASIGEIEQIMSFGVTSESIILSNPTKYISHIRFAKEKNIDLIVVDNNFELEKMSKHYATASLVLRIRYDSPAAQHSLGQKFGCNPDTEAPDLITMAKSLRLNMVGISFHVGSDCSDPSVYAKAIEAARKLFDFAETIGYHFKLLDIGGGFPGLNYTGIDEFASIINHSLDLNFPSSDVTIIAEPGRYYVASAFTLACRVHSKREVHENGKLDSLKYYINNGVFGSLQGILYYEKLYPLTLKAASEEEFGSSVWGQTCHAYDLVYKDVSLPRLDIGDFIIFENIGAYSIPLACKFNGFPLAKVKYYIERKHWQDFSELTIPEC